MREEFMSTYAKTVCLSFSKPDEFIQSACPILLSCVKSDPLPVSQLLYPRIWHITKDPKLMTYFKHCPKIFHKWITLVKLVSTHFHRSENAFLNKIIDKTIPHFFSVLRTRLFEEHQISLIVFAILSTSKISDKETLTDICDILFNAFKTSSLFKSSSAMLRALYLKTDINDFSEIMRRILPQLFPKMMKIMRREGRVEQIWECLKLIEFFKVTENEGFILYEGSLIYQLGNMRKGRARLPDLESMDASIRVSKDESENVMNFQSEASEESIALAIERLLVFRLPNRPEITEMINGKIEASILHDIINS
jgi:hypothetical protein